MNHPGFRRFLLGAALLMAATVLVAQEAKLKVEVKPKEAFIFLDGKPYSHHVRMLELTAGEHTIGVFNYGFVPQVKTVILKAGKNPDFDVTLEPIGEPVQGPWGRLKIEGAHNRDAVFLNGRGQEFFVGHVDEATSHVFEKQQLVLPPGIHQVYMVDPRDDKEVFAGKVEIIANRKAILDAETGNVRYETWSDGATIHSLPRFSSDGGETIVAVAPVTGKLTAEPGQMNCGQPVRLAWTSIEGVHTTIKENGVPLGPLPLSGEQTVSPKATTTYEFETVGPGGVFITKATVHVNSVVQTSLTASPAELRYHRVGDKVVEQGTATLNWSASNADSVRIDPIGSVDRTSGTQSVTALPAKSDLGPVAEMRTYRITATNACGGTDTSTASVHITGSIDPEVAELTPPPVLPQTASPLPLIGLLGLGSLLSGYALSVGTKRR